MPSLSVHAPLGHPELVPTSSFVSHTVWPPRLCSGWLLHPRQACAEATPFEGTAQHAPARASRRLSACSHAPPLLPPLLLPGATAHRCASHPARRGRHQRCEAAGLRSPAQQPRGGEAQGGCCRDDRCRLEPQPWSQAAPLLPASCSLSPTLPLTAASQGQPTLAACAVAHPTLECAQSSFAPHTARVSHQPAATAASSCSCDLKVRGGPGCRASASATWSTAFTWPCRVHATARRGPPSSPRAWPRRARAAMRARNGRPRRTCRQGWGAGLPFSAAIPYFLNPLPLRAPLPAAPAGLAPSRGCAASPCGCLWHARCPAQLSRLSACPRRPPCCCGLPRPRAHLPACIPAQPDAVGS